MGPSESAVFELFNAQRCTQEACIQPLFRSVRNKYRCCRCSSVQPHLSEGEERPKPQWLDAIDGALFRLGPLLEDRRHALIPDPWMGLNENQLQQTQYRSITYPRSPSLCAHGLGIFLFRCRDPRSTLEPLPEAPCTTKKQRQHKKEKGCQEEESSRVESSFWTLAHRSISDQSYQDQQWPHCGKVFRSQQANEVCSLSL